MTQLRPRKRADNTRCVGFLHTPPNAQGTTAPLKKQGHTIIKAESVLLAVIQQDAKVLA